MHRSLCSQRHHRDQKSNFAFHDALPVHVEGAWVSQLSSRSVQFSRRFICCGRGGFRHFPSAFNSSHVLPPCLRRRSVIPVRFSRWTDLAFAQRQDSDAIQPICHRSLRHDWECPAQVRQKGEGAGRSIRYSGLKVLM